MVDALPLLERDGSRGAVFQTMFFWEMEAVHTGSEWGEGLDVRPANLD